MTREGFVTFARTPAEDFKLCMEIMVQLVSWANGGKVLSAAQLGEGVSMAQFLTRPATKAIRQVLLNSNPAKWR